MDEGGVVAQAERMVITTVVNNYVGGRFVPPETKTYLSVSNPATASEIGRVAVSSKSDVDKAVEAANQAYPAWAALTIKARAAIMFKFHSLIQTHAPELAQLIVQENGKNITEALADVAKGNETVEYACSLPQLAQGHSLMVSSSGSSSSTTSSSSSFSKGGGGVSCRDRRDPLGVVVSIVPFNFPFMVPMWTTPIALVMGNCVIVKPSEKVPLTMNRVAELSKVAGFPDGVFSLVQGTRDAVEALIDHPDIKAVTFVGSTPVAEMVASRCRSLSNNNKRVTALGGAKNHLVALPDCEIDGAASDICVSFAGCAGQRCMAASVLLLIGNNKSETTTTSTSSTPLLLLLDKIVDKAQRLEPGTGPGQMGPVIDSTSYNKIISFIEQAETDGAKILLDGRSWKQETGHWIGPTIILHSSPTDATMQAEVFGPVLSVYVCSSWEEAIAIENANEFGNAASVYTTNGGSAEWFLDKFRASMLGVNIGIPVPREPFSFGGLYGTRSKFGDMDITGDAAIEFFSNRIKITSKWPLMVRPTTTTTTTTEATIGGPGVDHANFAGTM